MQKKPCENDINNYKLNINIPDRFVLKSQRTANHAGLAVLLFVHEFNLSSKNQRLQNLSFL